MRRTIVFTLIIFLTFNCVQASEWITSLEDAKKLALATNKLVLVDFWATWCGPCKRMDSESWSQEEVRVLMDSYVAAKIDIDTNKGIANTYGVQGIPYIFIMDGNGKVLFQEMSYKTKPQVMALLKKYALNTEFLNHDMINFYHKQNFLTSYRLASKYQDYSLYLDDNDVKRDFLRLAEEYLKESKGFLKNPDVENKEALEEKISLHEIQAYLIQKNHSKALKKMEKIKYDSVHKINKPFLNFLYYVAYAQAKDEKNSNAWKEKLSDFDLKKAELFLKS